MRLALLALCLGGAGFVRSEEPPLSPPETIPRAELERLGATIRAVNITIDNVFDLSNPEEDKGLYRWANRVHIRTRGNVIRSVLLFKEGDQFEGRLLDETARTLRARGYLADAAAEPGSYDPLTNTVDVNVRVRDSWTLAPDVKLSHSGGKTEWAVGLSDANLFGTGKELTISYASEIDRDETFLAYSDPNVFDSRVRLHAVFASADDGHRKEFSAERPFFALDTRWSLGGSVRNQERVDTMYDLGKEIDEFRHDLRSFTFQGGWSHGLVDRRAKRWLLGVSGEEDTFSPTPSTPNPLLLPPDRKLVYPWLGWQLLEDDFREMSELNDIGRTEDISLGFNMLASIGLAREQYGSDRDATLLRFTAQKGWEPGGSGRLLLINTNVSGRRESGEIENGVVSFGGRYYRRNLERHLFSISLKTVITHNLDPEYQVLLGGDNGLRGYPLRYQAGGRSTLLNVEQRFFTELFPWRLFHVGYAIFADVGHVGGRDPRATAPKGTLSDVGAGLRLSSPRSNGKSVVHIDVAFPINADPSIDSVQFVVETKGSF